MVKAEILVGIAASNYRFKMGKKSELCFFLRIEGKEAAETTCLMPYAEILLGLQHDIRDFAISVVRRAKVFGFREFTVHSGWRNDYLSNQDVRCMPLPRCAVDELKNILISRGLREVKK